MTKKDKDYLYNHLIPTIVEGMKEECKTVEVIDFGSKTYIIRPDYSSNETTAIVSMCRRELTERIDVK